MIIVECRSQHTQSPHGKFLIVPRVYIVLAQFEFHSCSSDGFSLLSWCMFPMFHVNMNKVLQIMFTLKEGKFPSHCKTARSLQWCSLTLVRRQRNQKKISNLNVSMNRRLRTTYVSFVGW